jgi:hypothetical protein
VDDQTEFLWKVHSYTNEYIRFADAKASVVIAWAGALLGALFSQQAYLLIFRDWTVDLAAFANSFSVTAAHLALAIGFSMAVYVVLPRLNKAGKEPRPNELIFWGSVRAFSDSSKYLAAVSTCNDEDRCVADHIYVIGGIAAKKYSWLRTSIVITAIGTLLAIYVLCGIDA